MTNAKYMVSSATVLLVIACFLGALVSTSEAGLFGWGGSSRPERTVASFEETGKEWGKVLWKEHLKPGGLNEGLIDALINRESIDFFNAHSELKDAFKKGFRLGYEDRIADLVLGPHLTEAAGRIGYNTSKRFVDVITAFEDGWAQTLRNAVEVFIVLISEGSQADRELFIDRFTNVYADKYRKTQEILKSRGYMAQVSEGGTMLYIDYSKGKSLGALDIPSQDALKAEIYRQTFKVMGDEWGRRYSTNLIKRDDLIDLLRRCKTALQEVPVDQPVSVRLTRNLGIIYDSFIKSYGTDAENVFVNLIRAAGYSENPVPQALAEPLNAQHGTAQTQNESGKNKTAKKKR